MTAWTSSVAAGKGNAGPSRPGVSCRSRKTMTMALASPPGEAWAEQSFWGGHRHGDPIKREEDTSHVFSLRKQSLKEKCWAILALLEVGDHSAKGRCTLAAKVALKLFLHCALKGRWECSGAQCVHLLHSGGFYAWIC